MDAEEKPCSVSLVDETSSRPEPLPPRIFFHTPRGTDLLSLSDLPCICVMYPAML